MPKSNLVKVLALPQHRESNEGTVFSSKMENTQKSINCLKMAKIKGT